MHYKKTFLMNVVFAVLAITLAITAFYFHIIEEHQYSHLPVFFIAYGAFIATPVITAISLRKYEEKWISYLAAGLNLVGTCIFFYPVYKWLSDVDYRDFYLQDIITYLLIYLIPSLINLRALTNHKWIVK